MNDSYSLHRKRPGAEEDRLVGSGIREQMLDQYASMPRAYQEQSFMMLGSMKLNHLEVDNMVRARRDNSED